MGPRRAAVRSRDLLDEIDMTEAHHNDPIGPSGRPDPPPLSRAESSATDAFIGLSLSTLVMLRWIAVVGQAATLLSGRLVFDLDVEIVPCMLAVGALAFSNLALQATRRRRLTEGRAVAVLAFDIVQFAFLIALTGGLQNPFALLFLAPVTVSATILSRRATISLTVLAVLAATGVAYLHLPLPWNEPWGLETPALYQLGIWTAVAMSLVFIATYVWTASEDARRLTDAMSETAAALAREREMSSLGALAAAAAHELGSPLATIAVVAKELESTVTRDSPLREDIELLKSQSDRCREILVGLSRQPDSRAGHPFEREPLSNLVEEAADEHVPDEIDLDIALDEGRDGPEPLVARSPELLHGIGNFASNAGQYARVAVTIRLTWTTTDVWVTIKDDGPGFSSVILPHLGEPYMSTRSGRDGHMGLGVFIATTLLGRIGAECRFGNDDGAEIQIRWPRQVLEHGIRAL